MKSLAKTVVNGIFILLVLPSALLSAFGRFKAGFNFFAHLYAFVPGILGEYVRSAYYFLTLRSCSLKSRISFGTFFSHRGVTVDDNVYIGAYCILGHCRIGARTQIGSGVHVLSGERQHTRDEQGRIQGAEKGHFSEVHIGPDCWIGSMAVVMADIGEGTTIGAGAVVTRAIPPKTVAVGVPARPIAK